MTIAQALAEATTRLTPTSDSPALDAEILLAYALNSHSTNDTAPRIDRAFLAGHAHDELTPAAHTYFATLIVAKPEEAPTTLETMPLSILVPSFILSEMKTAFEIGFLIYLPFVLIDMVISMVLLTMGMMVLPPVVISLPFKLMLFVLVDGWNLVVGSLVSSFK